MNGVRELWKNTSYYFLSQRETKKNVKVIAAIYTLQQQLFSNKSCAARRVFKNDSDDYCASVFISEVQF